MSTFRDVAARLTDVLSKTDDARAVLASAIERLEEAREIFDDALSGSSWWDVREVSERHRYALDDIEDLRASLTTAEDSVRVYRDGLVGGATTVTSVPEATQDRPPTSGSAPPPVTVPPERIEQLRDQLPPPVVPGTGQRTHGRWVGPDGEVHTAVSGGDSTTPETAKLLMGLLQTYAPPVTISHVEIKLAALMRESGIQFATLVINNVPCGDKWGCDTLLPTVLPSGSTLTIHGPNGFEREYRGEH